MKAVSAEYKQEMLGLLRDRSFVEVTFYNIDPTAAADGQWQSGDGADWSETETLDYRYTYDGPYATLELNRWELGGDFQIFPDDTPVADGFVSDALSSGTGNFPQDGWPRLRREFSQPHVIRGITVTFGARTREYPNIWGARFFLDGELVDEQHLYYYDEGEHRYSPVYECRTEAPEVDAIEVFCGTVLPFHRERIEHILFGVEVVFTNNELYETTQSDDIDPLSRRLPEETLSFTILDYEHRYDPDNPEGEYQYIEENSPVSIRYGYLLQSGKLEWQTADWYLLDSKPDVQENKATFHATGLIGRMTGTYYKGKIGKKTFYEMAEDVLLDAGLALTQYGGHPWVIDDSLKKMTTTAVMPIASHMDCLQMIAHACRCRMYTDDENIIHIEPFAVTTRGIYSGTYWDNGHTDFSEFYTVDSGNSTGDTYATLELNRWELADDSKFRIVPDDDAGGRGYVSSWQANFNGQFNSAMEYEGVTFSIGEDGELYLSYPDDAEPLFELSGGHLWYTGRNPPIAPESLYIVYDEESANYGHLLFESVYTTLPTFVKTFDAPHDLPVVKIQFDAVQAEYPLQVLLKYYKGDTLLDQQTVLVSEVEATASSSLATDCTSLEVSTVSTLPYYRARATKLYFRETDFTLKFDSVYSDGNQRITKIDKLKAVSVAKYSYVPEESGTVIENVDSVVF